MKAKIDEKRITNVILAVKDEFRKAASIHPKFPTEHHGYAMILEELDELKKEVWKKKSNKIKMREEAIRIAASAIRFYYDLL